MPNVVILGKNPDGSVAPVHIEVDASGSLITISHEHSKVHQGKMFSTGYLGTGIANGASINLLIQAHASYDVHTYIKITAGGDALFYAYENPTFSAAGTALTPVNHNRGSSNTSNLTATHTPTLSADGDLLWAEFTPGGSAGVSPGVVETVTAEQMVMAAGSDYLFRLTNDAGTAQNLQIMLSFYEVPA